MNIFNTSILSENKLEELVDAYVQQQLDSMSIDALREYARTGLYAELSEDCHVDDSNFDEYQVLNELNMNEVGKNLLKGYLTEEEMELVTDEILD